MRSSTAPAAAASSKCKNCCLHSMFLMRKLLRSNFVCSQWQWLDACATESHVMPHWIRNETIFSRTRIEPLQSLCAVYSFTWTQLLLLMQTALDSVSESTFSVVVVAIIVIIIFCHYFELTEYLLYSFVCEQCAMCIQNNDAEQWTAFEYMFWYMYVEGVASETLWILENQNERGSDIGNVKSKAAQLFIQMEKIKNSISRRHELLLSNAISTSHWKLNTENECGFLLSRIHSYFFPAGKRRKHWAILHSNAKN